MSLRSNPRVLTSTLLAALGIVPAACGGESMRVDEGSGGTNGGDGGGYDPSGGRGGVGASPNGGNQGTGATAAYGGSIPTSVTGGVPATGGDPATGGTDQGNPFPCVDPVDIGAGTSGFVLCASGAKHRPSVETCPIALPRPEVFPDLPGASCASDLDCQNVTYGFCADGLPGEFSPRYCHTGCSTDADCGPWAICECGDFVGTCVPATCMSDADCIPDYFCQTHDALPGCDVVAYACQQPGDTCGADSDCATSTACSASSTGDQARSCVPRSCTPGRPFFVNGAARTAPLARRLDWLAMGPLPDISTLPLELRERAGAWYADCAALEHASVASFARFTLGLLAVGAPSALVADSVSAMKDEIEHARATYALSSHYLGRAIGPGPLVVEGALEGELGLAELALSTFVEGCVDETLGAVEAREAAAHAVDPALRATLERIADDEARHAALAFRFVAWALERSGSALRKRLWAALETARTGKPACDEEGDQDDRLAAHGVLTGSQRRGARLRAFEDVVEPCVRALFERAGSAPAQAFASV